MDTQGLPREGWGAFFDDLSREFEAGQVTVEVSGAGLPHVALIESLPLLGVTLNTKGSPDADQCRPRRPRRGGRRPKRRARPGPDAHPLPVFYLAPAMANRPATPRAYRINTTSESAPIRRSRRRGRKISPYRYTAVSRMPRPAR